VSDLGKLGTPEHAVKVVKNIDDIVDALGYYSKNYTELTYMNWLGDFFSQKRHGNKLLEIYGLYSDH
jgi:hypothetical protein